MIGRLSTLRRLMPQDPIASAFARLVQRTPLAPLVVSPERRATAEDVDALARAAGSVLAGLALPPGSTVGLVAPNGPGFLASFLALRRAGLAALLLDGQTPEAEAQRIVRGLGAAALLRCGTGWPAGPEDWSLLPAAPALAQGLHPGLPNGALRARQIDDQSAQDSRARRAELGSPGCQPGASGALPPLPDIAVIKLTSGSTGAPRGIATPAGALLADDAQLTATMGIRPDDRLLATVPLAHSYGLSSLVLPALVRGTMLILPEVSSLFDPFVAAERAGATVFPTVPAYLEALLRLSEAPPRPRSLRLVLTAGALLAPATARRFREAFSLPVHVFYGASECGGICYDRTGEAGERGTVGTPVEGVQVALEPLDATSAGDGIVTVVSPAVAAGYFPDPDPRLRGGRFVGGDLAAWRGGELVLRARLDDMVNVRGKKVNPREVEEVLCGLAGVDEAVVLGIPVPERSGEMLRAVVACRPGRLSVEQIHAWCRARLAPHKVPRSVILVPEMPRTPRGKIDRPAILGLGREPVAKGHG